MLTVRAAHAPALDAAASDWVLTVDRGRVPAGLHLSGGQFVARAGVRAFLSGHLSTPSSLDAVIDTWPHRGESALSDLRGQFVLVLADEAAGDVRIVRDPVGAHPVYFAITRNGFAVSPSIAAIVRLPDVSTTINRVAVADHLCKRWPDKHETFFQGVRRLPQGWLLHISDENAATRRYWQPSTERIDWLPDEEIDRFDELLDQAVARGLTGRAGIFLSGGFDSVSVAAVAADLARRNGRPTPRSLSLGFPDPACDEQYVQRNVARALGLPIDLVPFSEAAGPRGLLRESLELNIGLSAPLLSTWMPAYLTLLRRAQHANIDTILTGEGGDEWLGVSPFFTADLLAKGDVAGVVRMARTWQRSYRQDWFTVMRGTVWSYGLRPLVGRTCHRLAPRWWDTGRARKVARSTPAWLSPDPSLRQAQFDRAYASLPPADPAGGFYSRESQATLECPLQSWLFDEQFELGGRYGVRYVHPYWDPDLVAHVYRVRPERLNADDRTKALVRRTLARRFPELGFERQRKAAAMDFFAGVLENEAPSIAATVDDFRGLVSLGIVDAARARTFMSEAWRGLLRDRSSAWNLVNMEHWVRQYL